MKLIGENTIYYIISRWHNYLGRRKFEREIIKGNKELDYGKVKELWNEELRTVHGDMTSPQYYFSCIDEILDFKVSDHVVDIGCGDGIVDSYINSRKLLGIDISENKLNKAREKNPNYVYHMQSFLDGINLSNDVSFNKCFSYSVAQYCKPEDIDKLIKNSIDVILKKAPNEGVTFHKKIVAHLEVPDIEKAFSFYHRQYGISEKDFAKYKNNIRTIFDDGSYWHDMREIKEKCLKYLAEKNVNENVIVYLNDSHCYYRTDLVVILIDNEME